MTQENKINTNNWEQTIQDLINQNNFAEAQQIARCVIINALQTSAMLGLRLGDPESAVRCAKLSLEVEPENKPLMATLFGNLSYFYGQQGKLEKALKAVENAIEIDSSFAEFYINKALLLSGMGKIKEAINAYNKALEINPEHHMATFYKGCMLMMSGQSKEGYELMEYRFKYDEDLMRFRNRFSKPDWTGQDLKGKKLLVFSEQGMGDLLQNMRYVPLLKARGAYLITELQEELKKFFPDYFDVVIGRTGSYDTNSPPDFPEYDYAVSFNSLPLYLDPDLKNIPDTPYISVKEKFPLEETNKLKVGICWAGSVNHLNDHNRSCHVKRFLPLSKVKGIQLYSLQKGNMERIWNSALSDVPGVTNTTAYKLNLKEGFEELNAIDLENQLTDFYATATIINSLDLLITVDTSIAHLAGAMGKPVWMLVAYCHDHRWFLEREDTHWYKSMRLFRHQKKNDWQGTIKRVVKALKTFVSEHEKFRSQ